MSPYTTLGDIKQIGTVSRQPLFSVNLKSNTMKNTLQRYDIFSYYQTLLYISTNSLVIFWILPSDFSCSHEGDRLDRSFHSPLYIRVWKTF